jgi:hypothetical protein
LELFLSQIELSPDASVFPRQLFWSLLQHLLQVIGVYLWEQLLMLDTELFGHAFGYDGEIIGFSFRSSWDWAVNLLLQKSYAARQYLLVEIVYLSGFVSDVKSGSCKVSLVSGDWSAELG